MTVCRRSRWIASLLCPDMIFGNDRVRFAAPHQDIPVGSSRSASPHIRSATGGRAETGRSPMPMAWMRRMKAAPYAPSRSRIKSRGGSSQPQASVEERRARIAEAMKPDDLVSIIDRAPDISRGGVRHDLGIRVEHSWIDIEVETGDLLSFAVSRASIDFLNGPNLFRRQTGRRAQVVAANQAPDC
jgi:hypothetical protein